MKTLFLIPIFAFLMTGAAIQTHTSYDKLPAVKKAGNYTEPTAITPVTLNPLLTTDVYSRDMSSVLFLPLFETDGETYNSYPSLASKVEVSKDKKEYLYTLNPLAKWTDGSAVTSDDIEYTFKQLMNPKVEAAALRGFYDGVSFTKVDSLKFKFRVEVPRYNTEDFLNGFVAIQKKQFEKEADFNKTKENLRPIGTGPYVLKSLSRDQAVVLDQIPNWWAKDLPQYKARYNFQTLTFKIVQDQALMYEKFIKGDLDSMGFAGFTPDQFVTQVNGKDQDRFGKSEKDGKPVWAAKFAVQTPMVWRGIALNLKDAKLGKINTRKGLASLVDYQAIVEKAFQGMVDQSFSPFGSLTDNVDPALKDPKNRYHFDPKKAAEYFQKDGWVHEGSEPFLVKRVDGKDVPFRIQLKYGSNQAPVAKAAVMLKESFKKSGVDIELKPMDSTALYKDFEDKNFEAMIIGWGGGSMYPDPKQIWSSESIEQGSNKVSYTNVKVDALIKKANLEFDRKKRVKMIQEIGKIIYDEVPYIFLVEQHTLLQGLNSRIKSPKWVERYGSGLSKDLFHE